MSNDEPGFSTLSIHAGARPDPTTGARITPIYQTTAFVFDDVDHAASLFGLQAFGNIYTRITNPTTAALEERVAALEGAPAALAVASGHAAQVVALHALMQPGDEFIASTKLYGGSINQFNHAFKSFGWQVKWADPDNPDAFRAALDGQDPGDLCRVDRQSRRRDHRPGGDRENRARGQSSVHRRQHAGDAVSHPPDRSRRRHHHPFRDQISGRPRQFDGRNHRRLRRVRMDGRQALSHALRAAARI